MSEESLENTTMFVNERPPDGRCDGCGGAVLPFIRPACLGLPPRWLSPPTYCVTCRDKQKSADEVMAKQKLLDEVFKNSRVSLRFKHYRFSGFEPTLDTQMAFDAARNYQPNKSGILFFGPCGVGKTHLAASIANEQLGRTPLLFISCPELLAALRESYNGLKKDVHVHLLSLARQVQLLILDDIGAEKSSEWVQETLFVLINYRYEHMLPTVLTTNFNLDELEERIGNRITSRLVEMCRCIGMAGEDWRIKKRKKEREVHLGN